MSLFKVSGRGSLGRFLALTLAVGFIEQGTFAQDRVQFAVVNYEVIFKEYYKSVESNQRLMKRDEEFKKEINEILNSLKLIEESLQKLQSESQSPVISESKKKEIIAQFKDKQIEFVSRQKLFEESRQQRLGLFQKQVAQEQQALIEDINKSLATMAKNKYNIIFSSSRGLPSPGSVTYSDGIDDITQQLLAILNKDAPIVAKKEEKK